MFTRKSRKREGEQQNSNVNYFFVDVCNDRLKLSDLLRVLVLHEMTIVTCRVIDIGHLCEPFFSCIVGHDEGKVVSLFVSFPELKNKIVISSYLFTSVNFCFSFTSLVSYIYISKDLTAREKIVSPGGFTGNSQTNSLHCSNWCAYIPGSPADLTVVNDKDQQHDLIVIY